MTLKWPMIQVRGFEYFYTMMTVYELVANFFFKLYYEPKPAFVIWNRGHGPMTGPNILIICQEKYEAFSLVS